MRYVCHHRFRGKSISGEVNIPAMTQLDCVDGMIILSGSKICAVNSENGHQHFARDDDGNGMLRGRLTQDIMRRLRKNDKEHQKRWNAVWDDAICQKYKRDNQQDYWLWNNDFYSADIASLQHIARLVGAKEGKKCIE